MMRLTFFLAAGLCASGAAWAQPAADLPDLPGKDVFQRICSGCHPVQVVLGKGMSREQWGGIVSNMISRGAKGTDAEFAQIVDYLTAGMPPHTTGGVQTAKRKPSGGLLDQAGAADKQIVDDDAAARGRTVYIAQCITCHGQKARGTSNGGVDIVRSLVVLKDRYGDQIGPFLKKGHPMQSGMASTGLTSEQIVDLSHFLHQQVGDTLRTGPYNKVLNVLTGDPAEAKPTSTARADARDAIPRPATSPASPVSTTRPCFSSRQYFPRTRRSAAAPLMKFAATSPSP